MADRDIAIYSESPGTKRKHSEGTGNTPTDLQPKKSDNMDLEPSEQGKFSILLGKLNNIESTLSNTVTKEDLAGLSAKLVGKDEFALLQARVEAIEIEQKAGPNTYQNPRINDHNRFVSPPRLNVIIEGLPLTGDPYKLVMDMAAKLNVQLDHRDFSIIIRMKKRTQDGRQTSTILVGFLNMHLRDQFYRKRTELRNFDLYKRVWLNADEPEEVRKQRKKMRQVAYNARKMGKNVYYTYNSIRIEGVTFQLSEVDHIVLTDGGQSTQSAVGGATSESSELNRPVGVPGIGISAAQSITVSTPSKEQMPQRPPRSKKKYMSFSPEKNDPGMFGHYGNRNIKIKHTKAGITFSGPTAFLSNFYESEFTYDDIQYTCVEQGYQNIRAIHHGAKDLSIRIMAETDPYVMKLISKEIKDSLEWQSVCEVYLYKLAFAKFDQNSDLMEQLLSTYPLQLVEANNDMKWAGGAPFGSLSYEEGIVKGENKFGKIATKIRDTEFAKRVKKTTSVPSGFTNDPPIDILVDVTGTATTAL